MTKELSFEEWAKSQCCKWCKNPLDLSFKAFMIGKTVKLRDVDYSTEKGAYHGECYDRALAELMNKRYVETYKGQMIFVKDGRYSLWQSAIYCLDLEDMRMLIDYRMGQIKECSMK